MVKLNQLLNKYEKFIPVILFIFFFLVTAPGSSWGLPTRLHPHEVIKVALKPFLVIGNLIPKSFFTHLFPSM